MMGAWCSLLTPRLSPKAECCGTAPCGDGGGTFCVCWFALARPLPACEGCTMSRGVSAGPWSSLGRWLAQNNQHPKPGPTG